MAAAGVPTIDPTLAAIASKVPELEEARTANRPVADRIADNAAYVYWQTKKLQRLDDGM